MNFLSVGLGGALGSMLRYGLSLFTIKMEFPAITFLTNFAAVSYTHLSSSRVFL